MVLDDGIPGLAVAREVAAAIGLARLIDTSTLGVEEPAVVAAADAGGFHLPEEQSRSAVAAAWLEQPDGAVERTEQHEILGQHPHRLRKVGHVGGTGHRMPVAPEQLARRRARRNLVEIGVGRAQRAAIRAAIDVHEPNVAFVLPPCPVSHFPP